MVLDDLDPSRQMLERGSDLVPGLEPPQGPQEPQGDPIAERLRARRKAQYRQEAEDRDKRFAVAYSAALKSNPDRRAEAVRLAEQLGHSPDAVEQDLEVARAMVKQEAVRYEEWQRRYPKLVESLTSDLDFATIVADDLEQLAEIESLVGLAKRSFHAGRALNERGYIGARVAMGWATAEEKDRLAELDIQLQQTAKDAGWISAITETVGQMSGTLPLAIGAGAAAAAPAAMAGPASPVSVPTAFTIGSGAAMFTQSGLIEGGNAYLDLIAQGYDEPTAAKAAFGVGLINGSLELIGAKFVAQPFKKAFGKLALRELAHGLERETAAKAFSTFAREYIKGHVSEVGTEMMQQAVNIAAEEWTRVQSNDPREGKTWDQMWDEMAQIFKKTSMAMSVLALPGPSLRYLADSAAAQQTSKEATFFESIDEAVAKSKTRERSPETLEEFIADTADGTDADTIYIDAKELQQAINDSGVSQRALEAKFPEIAEQLKKAREAGLENDVDVTIPTATYAARLSGSPLAQAIKPHMRLSAEAPSLAELQLLQQERKRLSEDAAEVLKEQSVVNRDWNESAARVYDNVLEQVRATGRMATDADARAAAAWHRDFVVVNAKRMGMTPEQFVQWRPIQIVRGETQAEAKQLEQLSGTRVVDAEGAPLTVYHGTRSDIVGGFIPNPNDGTIWFTDRPDTAALFAVHRMDRKEGVGEKVVPVRLNMRQPLEVDWGGEVANVGKQDEVIQRARAEGYDGVIFRNVQQWRERDAGDNFVSDSYVVFDNSQIVSAITGTEFRQDQPTPTAPPAAHPDLLAVSELKGARALAEGEQFGTVRDLKVELQKRVQAAAKASGIDLTHMVALRKGVKPSVQVRTDREVEDHLVEAGYRDALFALAENANAVGWYDLKTRQALSVMATMHKEIVTNEDARFAFTYVLATTSNGVDVVDNFPIAERAYRVYKATGKMPTNIGIGKAAQAINRTLEKFNELKELWGLERFRKMALTEARAGVIQAATGLEISGEAADTVVFGAAMMGPKIGNGFFANLYGIFHALTMDRWLVRTWGRWTGTLIIERPDMVAEASARLEAAIAALSPQQKEQISGLAAAWEEKGKPVTYKSRVDFSKDLEQISADVVHLSTREVPRDALIAIGPAADELRLAAIRLDDYLDGQKEDPAGPSERQYIRRVFGRVLDRLRIDPKWADLTMADLQAVLWYAEKRLYDAAKAKVAEDDKAKEKGYADDEAPDYANAAVQVARANGVAESEIDKALEQETDAGRARAARRRPAAKQGQARFPRGAGYSPGEARRFWGAVATLNARSARSGPQAASWSVTRKGESDDGRGRLLKKLGARVTAKLTLGTLLKNRYAAAGVNTSPVYELAADDEKSAPRFHAAISAFKAGDAEFGAAVHVYKVEDYAQMRLFLSESGRSGIAVKKDGDIVSLFSDEGAGRTMLEVAIASGGTKADAFDTVLPHIYAPHGIRVDARTKWNDKEAPPDWNKATFAEFNNGEPDVVMFVLDPSYFGFYEGNEGTKHRTYGSAAKKQGQTVQQLAVEFSQDVSAPPSAFGESFDTVQAAFDFYTDDRSHGDDVAAEAARQVASRRYGEDADLSLVGGGEQEAIDYAQEVERVAEAMRDHELQSGKRGGYIPERLQLLLYEKADLSTFLHESAHHYLTLYVDMLRAMFDLPEEKRDGTILADVEKLFDWFGIDGPTLEAKLAAWDALGLEGQRKHHEAFAYSYELHIHGEKDEASRAPTTKLEGIYARFTAWLRQIYETIRTELNAIYRDNFHEDLPILTGEVRDVMDRMVATEEEVRQAEAVRGMLPHFATQEQSGMDDATWAAYQQTLEEAHELAVTDLTKASLRQMHWLEGARSRVLRQIQARYRSERAQLKDEVTRGVEQMRVYRAIRAIRTGELLKPDGTTAPSPVPKMNTREVREAMKWLDAEIDIRRDLAGLTSEEGASLDIVASFFDYADGLEMLKEIAGARKLDEVVNDEVDRRMANEHSELVDERQRADLVERALHNEARARFVAVELRFLSKSTMPVRLMTRAAKAAAKQLIAGKILRDIRPHEFTSAEGKAARAAMEASKKGDPDGAIQAKRRQLMLNALAAEAAAAREEVAKAELSFKRFWKADSKLGKQRSIEYVKAGRAILAFFGLGKSDTTPAEHVEPIRAYNPELYSVLEPFIIRTAGDPKHYRDMTLAEFRRLRDAVDALWHQGRRDQQVRVEGELMFLETALGHLNERLDEIGVPTTIPGERQAVTPKEERRFDLNRLKALLRRPEHWAHTMDGAGEATGWFTKLIWRPVRQAVDRYKVDRNTYTKKLVEILGGIEMRPGLIDAQKELGYTFGANNGGLGIAELLGALMHIGNESNFAKLLVGRGWGELHEETGTLDDSRWWAFFNRMVDSGVITKEHMDAVQAIWDLTEEIKPMAQRAHRELFGFFFEEVPAREVSTKFGTYRGGYVPAKVDKRMVREAQQHMKLEELEADFRQSMPTTGRGFTKSRVEGFRRALSLDVRLIASHVDDVVRFAHIQPAVRDVMRILGNREFADRLTRLDPNVIEHTLKPWLVRTAQQSTTRQGAHPRADAFWRAVRSRTGISIMFWNVRNALQQLTGYFPSLLKVKGRYLKRGFWRYLKDYKGTTEEVAELSPYMAERLQSQIFDLVDGMNDILLNPSKYRKVQAWSRKHGYDLQSRFQNQVDIVTWIGAFEQALEELPKTMTDEQVRSEAVQRADAAVRQTQGSLSPEDVGAYEQGTPFYKTLIQFSGYFNMLANLNADEFTKVFRDLGWRGNKGKLFQIYLLGFAAPMLVSEALVRTLGGQWDDDDDDGHLDTFADFFFVGQLRGALAMVPGAGQFGIAGLNALDNHAYNDRMSTSPAIGALEAAVFGVARGVRAATDPEKTISGRNVKDALTLLSLITGVPVSAIGRTVGYEVDVAAGNVKPASGWDRIRGMVTGVAAPSTRQ